MNRLPTLSGIRIAHTVAARPEQAVAELYAGIVQDNMAAAVFFCSADYDAERLAAAIREKFTGLPAVGCTTAGELGPLGMTERGLSGVSFASSVCTAQAGLLADLADQSAAQVGRFARRQLAALQDRQPYADSRNSFGFLLIDGLSQREEQVCSALQIQLGNIALVGGSAGDGFRFRTTAVYFDGRFHDGSAVFLLLSLKLPFRVFRTQHFAPYAERMVVTAADARRRLVYEIDGFPAAQEYARRVGCTPEALAPAVFAAYPVVMRVGGNDYVRSMRQANADFSLSFYCAVEEGQVLHIARGEDLVGNLATAFERVRREIGMPLATLACDCALRKLECRDRGVAAEVADLFHANRVVGFNTYGEQFRGIHVNQTFAGIAIGAPAGGVNR